MIFASDNWAGASDAVMAALTRHNAGFAPAYGNDPLTAAVTQKFCRVFEKEVAVFFVATGTAANALALSAYAKPGGVIFCHAESHIEVDECGAPEFFSSGAKLAGIAGANGKIAPQSLEAAISKFTPGDVHHGQPAAVSITQASEAGTVYGIDEIRAIADVASSRGLALHMDGARFANALVHLGATPAEMTWKAGIDVLSFGATKNGCWCAEAVVFFDPRHAAQFGYLRKRGAQLISKSRFAAAQFEAYLADGHWLDLARHANGMALRLAEGIQASGTGRLAIVPQANEVFAIFAREKIAAFRAAGAVMHEWPGGEVGSDESMVRMVTSFRTAAADVDAFLALL